MGKLSFLFDEEREEIKKIDEEVEELLKEYINISKRLLRVKREIHEKTMEILRECDPRMYKIIKRYLERADRNGGE